jgi:YD repeat-containing protein
VYDVAGLPVETRVFKDSSTWVTTKRTFHPSGMVQSVKRPNEVAANAWQSEVTYYDGFILHPISRINQANQSVQETYDPATGALLVRTGPNYRQTGPGVYVDERETWTIDGFGRVLTHSDSLEPASGTGYDFRVVEIASYLDTASPARRITQRLRDAATGAWITDEQKLDGAGRVIETIAHRQLSGQPDARKLFLYDAGGELAQIDETSPETGAGDTFVATVFERDGVGRPTRITRPDGSQEHVRYEGLDTIVSEEGGASTTSRRNGFGELAEVHEHDNPVAGQTAITRYGFDPLGRMTSVLDADNTSTVMAYDWRGLRTSVVRNGRTWSFVYDANGNPTEQYEPVPAGGYFLHYRGLTTYDRLNRPLTVTPATRGMTAARMTQLGIGTTTYAYDGNNFVGAPHQITLPFGTIAFTYDATGRVKRETRAFNLNQGVTVAATQWVERSYDALGNPTAVRWDDQTEWRYAYDSRGAVSDVTRRDPATTPSSRSRTTTASRRGNRRRGPRSWGSDATGTTTCSAA